MKIWSFTLSIFFYGTILAAQSFPHYILVAGKPDADGNPFDSLSSARLCVVVPMKTCFTLPPEGSGDGGLNFYLEPKAVKTTSASGDELMLFSAHTMGGSGYAYEYALLRYSGGKLVDLLPTVRVSNISDRALWEMPAISSMPVFLTADFLWEDGAHYADHRYTVCVYRFDATTSKYAKVLSYDTQHTYPSADYPGTVHVLRAERSQISALLREKSGSTR